MNRKAVSETMLTLLLIGMLTFAFNIQPVKATETIYIMADGSVDLSEAPSSTIKWDYYHNYTEIVDILIYLNTTYPNIVDVFPIGESWQNRTIYCVRLTNESRTQPKPEVLFVGDHHVREPISAELPLYFVVQATTNYGTNETLTRMLDFCEIYVVVALNPDGFHIFEVNDWQRKNTRPIDEDEDGFVDEDPPEDEDGDGFIEALYDTTSGMFIRWEGVDNDNDEEFGEDWVGGVDLNRNYGFAWNASTQSGSTDPREEDYKGPAPFSEPETQALRDLALQHDFKYALSFHSGAEIIIYPWGYTDEPPPDAGIFDEIGQDLSTLIGCPYGQTGASLYTASGSWDDWMYGNRSVIAFTCEIFSNDSEWFFEPGPTPYTVWWGGLRYAFNPRPPQIENVLLRWFPVFTYITNRTISEAEEVHDVAVVGVVPSKTVVGQGYSISIDVTVENQGNVAETFNVSACANTTVIDTLLNITLTSGNYTTIAFPWNITDIAKANYTISAYATPVPAETDLTDNNCTDGWVVVTIRGDINGDYKVDIEDLVLVIKHFGSYSGHPNWNPNADINGDGLVDIQDLVLVIKHYGTAEP